jgi:predicted amidophosphoribosyltransferase
MDRNDNINDDYVDSLDDELDPEGPSVADLRRLRHSGAKCPSCGADVYDDAEVCQVCGDYIVPESGGGSRVVWKVVALVVLVAVAVMMAL